MAISYKQCETCGNYFLLDEENNHEKYCSDECRILYVKCTVCGDFYEKESDSDEDDENFICSEDCRKKYKFASKNENYELDFNKLK
jgi:hypothetical protein